MPRHPLLRCAPSSEPIPLRGYRHALSFRRGEWVASKNRRVENILATTAWNLLRRSVENGRDIAEKSSHVHVCGKQTFTEPPFILLAPSSIHVISYLGVTAPRIRKVYLRKAAIDPGKCSADQRLWKEIALVTTHETSLAKM